MKTIKKIIFIGILTLLSASCKKSEEIEPNNVSSVSGSKVEHSK